MGNKSFKSKDNKEADSGKNFKANNNLNATATGSEEENLKHTRRGSHNPADGATSGNDAKLTSADFELIKVLGKGAFGKVMLVKKKDDKTETLYAMKTLKKADLVKRNQVDHTTTERFILENIHCPFLVHLQYAFQTTDKLYMVLEFMRGGELFFWIKKEKKFSESRAKLYAAEITVALEHMHDQNIIYRDLKPENILLDADGHIRLADFGLAKGNITGSGAEGGTKTFCGTPEYLAPEILENKGHGKAVDWWALGTFLFEMIIGLPPFYDSNVQRMYSKILHEPLKFPKDKEGRPKMSDDAMEILRGLLERKVIHRLGSGPTGAKELIRTKFFGFYDFKRVLKKGYTPEFKPPTSFNPADAKNFDPEFTREKPVDSFVNQQMTVSLQEKADFDGFSYRQTMPEVSHVNR